MCTTRKRRLCLSVDIKDYARREGVLDQKEAQDLLFAVLDEAADRAGLNRPTWTETQRAGDSELTILPESEAEDRVVGDFVRHLAGALAQRNARRIANHRVCVRVAIHFGLVEPAPGGYAGPAPIVVARLRDSDPARQAAKSNEANVVLMVSDLIYQETVKPRMTVLDPDEFRLVRVTAKEYDETAWLWRDTPVASINAQERDAGRRELPEDGAPTATGQSHLSQHATIAAGDVFAPVTGISNNGPVL